MQFCNATSNNFIRQTLNWQYSNQETRKGQETQNTLIDSQSQILFLQYHENRTPNFHYSPGILRLEIMKQYHKVARGEESETNVSRLSDRDQITIFRILTEWK